MIYKVYAKCVRVAKSIQEISEEAVKEYISQETNEFFDHNDLDFLPHNDDDEYEDLIWIKCNEAVYDLIDELWNKNRVLECGDFEIIEADETPSRPDMCGSSHADICKDDVIAKMNITPGYPWQTSRR